ncbi:aldo/keto reductase [Longispora sp. K20-0274]|uniref:aldo/keto reductase n=1 Tax=Longispora sp. K20-0274 TaxID=3088255 RepID=UPI00399A3882
MTAETIRAEFSGTWTLGDLPVRRIGFGAMRLTQHGEAFGEDAVPRDRDQAVAPVVCVQNMYGIGVRPEHDAFVAECGEQGVAFVPFYAIASAGRQGGATGVEDEAVLTVARAHGVGAAEVRVAWTLHRGPHVLAIPGTGDPGHLESNVAAGALRLSDDDLVVLEAAHRA